MKDITQLFDTEPNARCLFIGSGISGADAAAHRADPAWFDKHYDVVLVPNQGYEPYIETADATKHTRWYSFIIETSVVRFDWFYKIPMTFTRILHEKNKEWLIKVNGRWTDSTEREIAHAYTNAAYGATRNKYELRQFNPRSAGYDTGLISGDVDDINHAKGTVLLQGMHFAALLGASSLDIVGCELCFAKGVQHYFEEGEPFAKAENTFPQWFTYVKLNGELAKTHKHFSNSAEYLDECYPRFLKAGMRITRCCDSLIKRIPRGELPQ